MLIIKKGKRAAAVPRSGIGIHFQSSVEKKRSFVSK